MNDGWTNEQSVASYAAHVQGIADDDNWESDVLMALTSRSAIEDDWDTFSPVQQAEVRRLDEELMQHRDRVAEMLPAGVDVPRSHWWWFLHETAAVVGRS